MKNYKFLLVTATVAMTGCVNWNSFNATPKTSQAATQTSVATKPLITSKIKQPSSRVQPPKPSTVPSPVPKPTPSPKVQPSSTVQSPKPSAVSPPAPKPTPTSSVIKQEVSSEVKVISSRPVVGTDTQMRE